MKKLLFTALFLLSAVAVAAVSIEVMDHYRGRPQAFHKGIYVTTHPDDSTTTLTNKLTSVLGASISFDFPFAHDAGASNCNDSTPISVPGANVGDPCSVGVEGNDGGTTNGSFSCYVSYANYARVRHCSGVASDNPGSATYNIRVFGH